MRGEDRRPTPADFTGRPLVVGEIFGLRTFALTTEGKLTSPVVRGTVFEEGVNHAQCGNREAFERAFEVVAAGERERMERLAPQGGVLEVKEAVEEHLTRLHLLHRPGSKDCQCGFYAYHSLEENYYHRSGNVQAVVAGSGVVTAGSKGFRCEKCRLVALVGKPRRGGVLTRALVARRVSPRAVAFSTLAFLTASYTFLVLFLLSGALRRLFPGDSQTLPTALAGAILLVVLALSAFSHYPQRYEASWQTAAAARHYPNIPWVPTLQAAAEAYPLGARIEKGQEAS